MVLGFFRFLFRLVEIGCLKGESGFIDVFKRFRGISKLYFEVVFI